MVKSQLLVSVPRYIDEVEACQLEHGAKLSCLVWREPLFVELNWVDLDAEDKVWGISLANLLRNLEDQASPVREAAAPFVGTAVVLCERNGARRKPRLACSWILSKPAFSRYSAVWTKPVVMRENVYFSSGSRFGENGT